MRAASFSNEYDGEAAFEDFLETAGSAPEMDQVLAQARKSSSPVPEENLSRVLYDGRSWPKGTTFRRVR